MLPENKFNKETYYVIFYFYFNIIIFYVLKLTSQVVSVLYKAKLQRKRK
jgi:hypothetical protein